MTKQDSPVLSWYRSDIEQRIGFQGGRYTTVNNTLSLLIAVFATLTFYGIVWSLQRTYFSAMFLQRGPIPYFIVFFFFWAMTILFFKSRKLSLQRRVLSMRVMPDDHDFVLSSSTASDVLGRINHLVDDPKHFLLFQWIVVALSNLRNIGRVSDVENIFRAQASHDESSVETSYSLVKGFVWAIPVLGFIGTVLGLSEAIGGFSTVLQQVEDVSQITQSLQYVVGGLSTAFETTLEALVAALIIQLALTFIKKSEEEFLDDCSDYCLTHVVNRLRIMPFESES